MVILLRVVGLLLLLVVAIYLVTQERDRPEPVGKKTHRYSSTSDDNSYKSDIADVEQDDIYLPYKKKKYLMNIPERKFYEFLVDNLPDGYVLFPQVVMSRIVQVDGISRWEKNSGYYGWRSKINKKTIDYVLFSKPYYQPVLCIEYDGKSHNKSDRKARDREVDAIFSTACLPILHVKHKITTKREILDFISDVLS